MSESRQERIERIALYVDGQLSGEERARVEAEIAASPEARAQVEAMRRMDASLRAVFGGVATASEVSPVRVRVGGGRSGAVVWTRNIAAVLAVAVAAWWFLWPAGQWPKSSVQPRTVDAFYDRVVERGFVPDAVCTDDAQFAEFTRQRVGLAMVAMPEPGVEIIGWGYPRDTELMGLPSGTVSLLARVDGAEVVVLLSPMDAGGAARTRWIGGHRVFRRDLVGVGMVEISPLATARVLPTLIPVPCPEKTDSERGESEAGDADLASPAKAG